MYKDKKGELIFLNDVVLLENRLWFISEIDNTRTNFLKLQNGCSFTYAQPQMVVGVMYVDDIKFHSK